MTRPRSELILDRVTEGTSAATCEAWVEHRLRERLWSKQREIAASVREHRYTAVPSAHNTGKSYLAARIVCHWLSSHPVGEAFAVTTAPTQAQVEAILWREIARAHHAGGLPGRITAGNVPMWKVGEEIIGYGRKPTDYADPAQAMQSFQGIHARYVLIVIDEACGIPRWLWDAVDSLATNEHARVLAIGNPDSPAAHFAKVCSPGSGWNVIHVDGLETPNFTAERDELTEAVRESLLSPTWVEERKRRWGEESALYQSKVRGLFPDVAEDTLIGADLIVAAQERSLSAEQPRTVLACDVARLGGDHTVIYRNRCGVVRLVKQTPPQDTMRTTGDLVALKAEPEHYGVPLLLDVGGLGIGIFDRLVEQGESVHGFNGAERAWRPDRFVNRRAEAFWALREALMRGQVDLDPLDEELAAQLGSLRWHRDSKGRIAIESKEELCKRGLPSPDRADAVSMTFALGDAWRPKRPRTPYDEAREFARQVEAAQEQARFREADGSQQVLTDEEFFHAPM